MKSLSIGLASQEAGQFLKREAGLLLPVALLFTGVPVAMLLQVIPPSLRQINRASGAAVQPDMPVLALLLMFLCPLLILCGTLTLYTLALRPGVSLGEALKHGARRMPVALAGALVMGLVLMPLLMLSGMLGAAIGSVVFLIGALLLGARMLLFNAVVTDLRIGILAGLRESWELSRGHLGRLLGFVILISIPVSVAQIVGQSIFGLIGFAIGGKEVAQQAGDVGVAFILSLGQMVMTILTAFIYRQLSANRPAS